MAQLQFSVDNQIITRTDTFKPVARSRNYLYAQFTFNTPEWAENIPTAIFRNAEDVWEVILESDNTCLVPWEALATDSGQMFVSVFSGDLVTSNKARVRLYETGYDDDLESAYPPSPEVYAQILSKLAEIEADHNNIDGGLFTDWEEAEEN